MFAWELEWDILYSFVKSTLLNLLMLLFLEVSKELLATATYVPTRFLNIFSGCFLA